MRLIEPMVTADRVMRAMTDDGAFRVIAASTSDTTVAACEAQNVKDAADRSAFAKLLTAAVLYRETMAPTMRVQCIVSNADGDGHLLADSHPDGWVRGLFEPKARPDDKVLLQMMRTLPNGELHRGLVDVSITGNLSKAIERYMQQSEQIESMVSLRAGRDGDGWYAHGFLVQLLPEASEAQKSMQTMTERLTKLQQVEGRLIEHGDPPSALLGRVLSPMSFTTLDDTSVVFGCNCSLVRVITSLATVGRDEISKLVAEGEALDLSCEYCGKHYAVEPEQLRGLLATS